MTSPTQRATTLTNLHKNDGCAHSVTRDDLIINFLEHLLTVVCNFAFNLCVKKM